MAFTTQETNLRAVGKTTSNLQRDCTLQLSYCSAINAAFSYDWLFLGYTDL
jgi:hypothetical protein